MERIPIEDPQYRQRAGAALTRVADAWLPSIRDATEKALETDRDQVLSLLRIYDVASSTTSEKVAQYFFGDSPAMWRSALRRPLRNLTLSSGALVSQYITDREGKQLTEEERWFLLELLYLSEQLAETSRERILWVLALAMAAGWTRQRVIASVRLVFRQWLDGDVTPDDLSWAEGAPPIVWRGDIISRTESIRFGNLAALWRYRRDGIPYKQWLTARDDRVCPYCSALDGKIVPTEQEFFRRGEVFQPSPEITPLHINYSDILVPPIHPLCRCAILPWRPEWGRIG